MCFKICKYYHIFNAFINFRLFPTKSWSWVSCLFFFALLHDFMISLTKNLDPSAKTHLRKLKLINWSCELNCTIQLLHCCLFRMKADLTKVSQNHSSKRECPCRLMQCRLISHLQLIPPNFPSVSGKISWRHTNIWIRYTIFYYYTKLATCLQLLVSDFLFLSVFFLLIFQRIKVQMFYAVQESQS